MVLVEGSLKERWGGTVVSSALGESELVKSNRFASCWNTAEGTRYLRLGVQTCTLQAEVCDRTRSKK